MDIVKDKQSDELLKRIQNELTAIIAEEAKDPERKLSYETLLRPNPLPIFGAGKQANGKPKKTVTFPKQPAHKREAGAKSAEARLASGDAQRKESDPSTSSSSASLKAALATGKWDVPPTDRTLRAEFMDSSAAKSIDVDLQKVQLELKQSYELFQGIGEKFQSINFSGLKSRIRDLHLNSSTNEMGKMATNELQKVFDAHYVKNSLDKLTTDVSQGFRRHPGEFGDIPELSTFFQACTQLEHGLDALKQQRRRSNELEKRLCWATEIAYDRMDEIRNAVGTKPESNF
ncbi:uncharacterized protein LOC6587503 [Drosophila persimilis]|uniref:uncharacterized protein LOC6587503 n=1 Tax=Drosophila persimilis TaxID=7234 RepID=UPI000F0751B9|nr:uncharacterized protein LOC6587503 [Drosophila persimilis]